MPIYDKSPRPQEFAAVDLGSNSFHMVIARVVDGAMQIIGRLKQRVHLADGLGADNKLSEEAMERGLSCLSLFAERLQGFSPSSVCIVGTHTLRQAQNAADFLKRAEKVIPYPIEIISGNEEARLIFMGVEHTQPEKGRKLVIDIGGGSTELVIGENFEPRLVESRRMGCVSFAQLYFPGGVINKENFQRARMAAAQKLAHPQLEALLRWAAMLHEVGLNINHSGLHRHSAYILQHSDLPGFNQEQQMMMATLVRYHRKAIKLDDMPRFTLFKKKQYLPLIQLLRLGVLLNNQRQATTTPPTLRLTTDDSHWTLCFPHDWFSQNALVLLDLEKEQQYWEAVTGWRLNIEEESSPEIAA